MVTEAVGEVENEDGTLVLKRIHVTYRLKLPPEADHDSVQRAFERHPEKCPVYRSISGAVDITLDLELED
jgi:uncharacterized OsmC-like protein